MSPPTPIITTADRVISDQPAPQPTLLDPVAALIARIREAEARPVNYRDDAPTEDSLAYRYGVMSVMALRLAEAFETERKNAHIYCDR